jgi:predicted amino acid-binding ACT domain protein/phosphoserine phosphatase
LSIIEVTGMAEPREIYVVCGMGRDVTGLVSLVTSIISDTHGNIIDMEEDVFHGLFSIFLTVDLTGAKISGSQFIAKMQAVAHQSGLQIIAEKQQFLPRLRAKRMMRLLLIGADHPGIVSSATFVLANNGVNVEGARMISRGELFAMEMDLDWSAAAGPRASIERSVAAEMKKIGMRCFLQTEDIYRKYPRLIAFTVNRNLVEEGLREELLSGAEKPFPDQRKAAAALGGLKLETVGRITSGLRLNSDGEDLLHMLKQMGFVVVLITEGFDLFLNPLLEYPYVNRIHAHRLLTEKARLTGELERIPGDEIRRKSIASEVARDLKVGEADMILIGDSAPAEVNLRDCGIRVVFPKDTIKALVSKKVITSAQIPAILSAFGPL